MYCWQSEENWFCHYGKQYGGSLRNLKQLPNDPAILLMNIYSKETKILSQKYIYTPMFFEALFVIDMIYKKT